MAPDKIYLVDNWEPLTAAWAEAFAAYEAVEVVRGDFFARDADALVSPANSLRHHR